MTKGSVVIALDTAGDAIALAAGVVSVKNTSLPHRVQYAVHTHATGDEMARREANVRLVPALDAMMQRTGLNKNDVAGIVCGRGPGSFTGVRIAVATAKGLAAGLNVPLYGVPTPHAIAWQCFNSGVRGTIGVVLDAMRGEVYPLRFNLTDEGVQCLDVLSVVKAAELADTWQPFNKELLLAGDALYKYDELFASFSFLDETLWRATGSGLMSAFEASLNEGSNDGSLMMVGEDSSLLNGKNNTAIAASIAGLLPVYTRLSDAEENERKRLARGGAIAQGALTEVPVSGVAWAAQQGQITLRPIAEADIEAMVVLEQQAYPAAASITSGERWTAPMYKEELAKANRSWWVCYQDNVLAGFIGGQLIEGQMHVLDVVVHEQYKRKGIAQKLIEKLALDAKDWGATELTLEVRASNAAAQALYTKLGLACLGRRPHYYSPLHTGDAREDAVIMTGTIDESLRVLQASSAPLCDENISREASAAHNAQPLILAIESSCDETAAALIDGNGQLLTNIVASQTDFHARFGGVVPEIASRKHTEAIYPVVMDALGGHEWNQLDAIAVTYAPGLIGALVVGVAFAKGLSWATGLPLVKVNHLEGHMYANSFVLQEDDQHYLLESTVLKPPFVTALLSGGNTLLVYVETWGRYKVLGQTLDDAIGEAYDKVAKALGLGYPGGPIIAQLAAEGNPEAIKFPRALLYSHDYEFSFSGLKTAVLTAIRQQVAAGTLNPADIAASFEQAVIDVQVTKALNACKSQGVTTFCIGGGVAANTALRAAYKAAMEPCGIAVVFPPAIACTDNAAMIAAVALDRFKQGKFAALDDDAHAQANLEDDY